MLTDQGQRHLPRPGAGDRREADGGEGWDGEVSGPYPLTHAQSGLWSLERSRPGSPHVVTVTGVRLRGSLDVGALREALADCVARQEALRARFVTLGGRPFQVFPAERPDLPVVAVSGDTGDGADGVRRRCDTLASTPLDPRTGPPLRAELLRLGPEHHVLALAVHRAVFDGWSARVLLAELGTAYGDRRRGTVPNWLPLDASFGELARGQRRLTADGGYTREQVAHWRGVLRDAPRLELPADRPRPAVRTYQVAALHRTVDAATAQGVRRLAGSLGVPPHTVLAAAFTHLLSRVSGAADIVVGLPLAARTLTEAHGVVGCFANTLPLRVSLAGARSFTELVERHREPLRELAARQDFPFEAVVDAVGRPQEADGRGPFYDVRFQHLPDPGPGLAFDRLDAELLDTPCRTSPFDLGWDVSDAGELMRVSVEYGTELFDDGTVASFADGFVRVLAGAVADPEALPEPLAAAAEPPAPRGGVPDDGTSRTAGGLAGVVAARAAERPEAPAVRYGRRMLTFRQLDTAATRISAALAERGAGPGTAVGLLLEPSARLPVAMLAILRAGAVYVPVDPAVPARRAGAMAEAAGCRLIVCDARTEARAAALGLPLLRLDGRHDGGGAPPARPVGRVTPATPAYAIFTSGSTGRPKAVLVQHGAALALAESAARAYGLGPEDVALQTASVGVDVSVEEFFASWWAGACVAVPEPGETDLDILISRHRATVLNLPPALWHPWVRRLRDAGESVREPVRLVVVGSDRVDPGAVRTWHEGVGRGTRLLNAYGTTETAVTATCYDTRELPGDSGATSAVPIGVPLPHVSVYVLDGKLRPVQPSMPGELWIGGEGVALGYLGDPAATAERFWPDPFSGRPGSRMYRTGDRVRVLPSGALDFLGRIDSQVKVRGFRVELEEVERVACEVPGVAAFTADVRPDTTGTGHLVGWILPTDPPVAPEPPVAPDLPLAAGGAPEVPADASVGPADIPTESTPRAAAVPSDSPSPADLGELELAAGAFGDEARLAGAIGERWAAVRPGGAIVVRGVRDLTTLHAYHASALAAVTDGEADAVDFATAVDEAVEAEDALCLHPAWFTALAVRLPGAVTHVGPALPRRAGEPEGHHYDVVLTRAATAEPARPLAADIAPPAPRHDDDRDHDHGRTPPPATDRAQRPADPLVRDGAPAVIPTAGRPAQRSTRPALPDEPPGHDRATGRSVQSAPAVNRPVQTLGAPRPGPGTGAPPAETVDGGELDLAGLERVVRDLAGQGAGVVVGGLRDLRTAAAGALAEEAGSGRHRTLEQARRAAAGARGVDPADALEVAGRYGYRAALVSAPGGRFDLAVGAAVSAAADAAISAPAAGPGVALANDPPRGRLSARLTAAVREHLREALPAPMVPARLLLADDFPRTASGKVDRRRLPDPPRGAATRVPRSAAAPRDALEQRLCAIWADVLGAGEVGALDNFFDLHGDSVAWTQIISLAGESGIPLGAPDVFDRPTVRELAAHLRSPRAGSGGQDRSR